MQEMEEQEIKDEQVVCSEIARRLQLELEVRMERMVERKMIGMEHMVERKMMDATINTYLGSYLHHSSHPNSFNFNTPPLTTSLHQHHTLPFQSLANSTKEQQLLQTTPSSNTIVMKRKAQSYEEKNSVFYKCLQKKKWYCSVCQVSATNETGFKLHLQGKKHLSNLQNSDPTVAVEKSSQQEKTPVSKKWNCSLCQISVTSEMLLISHFEGKKHKSKMTKHGLLQNSHNVVSLDQISQGVEERGHTVNAGAVKKNLIHLFQGKNHKANKGIIDSEIRDVECKLSDKVSVLVERKRGEFLMEKNQGNIHITPQLEQQEERVQKVMIDGEDMSSNEKESRNKAKVDANEVGCWLEEEMGKCDKYWYCEMCNEGANEKETMESHRKSDEHMTLLFQKGGNAIVVSRFPKE